MQFLRDILFYILKATLLKNDLDSRHIQSLKYYNISPSGFLSKQVLAKQQPNPNKQGGKERIKKRKNVQDHEVMQQPPFLPPSASWPGTMILVPFKDADFA